MDGLLLKTVRSLQDVGTHAAHFLAVPSPPVDWLATSVAERRALWWGRDTCDLGTMTDLPDPCLDFDAFAPLPSQALGTVTTGAHNYGQYVMFTGLFVFLVITFVLLVVRLFPAWSLFTTASIPTHLQRGSTVYSP